MKRLLITAVLTTVGAPGCTVSLAKNSQVGVVGVTSVSVDPSDAGVVYVVKDGKAQRCTKADGGKTFNNCQDVDIKEATC